MSSGSSSEEEGERERLRVAAVTSNDVFSTTQQHTESNGTKDILAGRLQKWLDRCSEHDHVDQISKGDFANPLSLSLLQTVRVHRLQ